VRSEGAGQARQRAPDAEVGDAERYRGIVPRVLDFGLNVPKPAAAARSRGLTPLKSARQGLREQRSEYVS
jgi:hypothetical protein